MRVPALWPRWAGWFIGAGLWIGYAVWSSVRPAEDRDQVWIVLALIIALVHVARGIFAFTKRFEPKHERRREELAFDELFVYTAVAATMLLSVIMGMRVLGVLSGLQ